jgi:hypothetical protein
MMSFKLIIEIFMSIQPVPKNPHSAAAAGAPATPAPSSTDPLSALLSMSPEEIARRGVPEASFSAWVTEFRNGLKDGTLVLFLNPETAWTMNSPMCPFFIQNSLLVPDTEQKRNEMWESFSEKFQSMTTKNFWKNPQEIQPLLLNMVLLYSITLFPPNHPVETAFLKFIDCFAKAIVPKPDYPYFILNWASIPTEHTPLRNEVCRYKQCFFLNTEEGWRVGIFDNFPNTPFKLVQFNPNRTKMLILDHERKPLAGSHMIVQANKPTDDENFQSKAALAQEGIVRTTICTGMDKLRQGKQNAVSFSFSTNLTPPIKVKQFRQACITTDNPAEKLSPQQVHSAREAAEALLDAFKDEFTSMKEREYANPVMFELASPQSALDHVQVRLNLLRELQKDPVANADLIAEAAEMMGCDFSEQELQTLVNKKEATITEEGCDISPKAVIDKLVDVAKTQYMLALKAPKAPAIEMKKPLAEQKTTGPVPPTPAPKKTKAKKTDSPEQQIAAGRQQAAVALEQQRLTPSNTAERPISEALPQDLSCLGYTPREQSQVASIYAGQPMKATQFTTFAMNLLRKQAAAKGASTSTNTKKGSHPTVHFKRSDGTSGGVTFGVHHGKKDAHGFAHGQRTTLEAIFKV